MIDWIEIAIAYGITIPLALTVVAYLEARAWGSLLKEAIGWRQQVIWLKAVGWPIAIVIGLVGLWINFIWSRVRKRILDKRAEK